MVFLLFFSTCAPHLEDFRDINVTWLLGLPDVNFADSNNFRPLIRKNIRSGCVTHGCGLTWWNRARIIVDFVKSGRNQNSTKTSLGYFSCQVRPRRSGGKRGEGARIPTNRSRGPGRTILVDLCARAVVSTISLSLHFGKTPQLQLYVHSSLFLSQRDSYNRAFIRRRYTHRKVICFESSWLLLLPLHSGAYM